MTARLAALISGAGRTALNLARAIDAGEIPAELVLVVASRACAGADLCRARGLTVVEASAAAFPDPARRDDAITQALVEAKVDLVCLCGYLRRMRLDPQLGGRVINIHPALLPEFGGHGMYGERVHAAVLAAGRRFSGCTVHVVEHAYDEGPILLQRACPVLADDDVATLAARVFAEELIAYPEAIRMMLDGRVRVERGRASIRPKAD